jgi:HK97 family phage major capsid protein
MSRTAVHLAQEAQALFKAADDQGRPLTPHERTYVEEQLTRTEEQGAAERRISELGRQLGAPSLTAGAGKSPHGGGPGDRFIQSPGWKAIRDPMQRSKEFTTGLVDVGSIALKGTLLEGAGSPGADSGGGLIPAPQVVDGVVTTLFQPLSFEGLLLAGVATGNTIRYAIEGTATSGAAGVREGGEKPESTIGVGTTDEPIKKIATSIVTSDELLEDERAVQQFVNSRLTVFVGVEVERQLFRGTSSSAEVEGIFSRGIPIYAGGTAAGNVPEQLFKAMNGTRGSAFVEPEWVAMHPTDWEAMRLLKDDNAQYYGGGPFMGQYGNANQAGAGAQITGASDYLWGKPIYVTSAIGGAGTALIGSRASAQVWSRGGLRVEASNSHSSFFTADLVAIRAERRLGLTVYRPDAFCEVRLET